MSNPEDEMKVPTVTAQQYHVLLNYDHEQYEIFGPGDKMPIGSTIEMAFSTPACGEAMSVLRMFQSGECRLVPVYAQ